MAGCLGALVSATPLPLLDLWLTWLRCACGMAMLWRRRRFSLAFTLGEKYNPEAHSNAERLNERPLITLQPYR